MRTLAFIALGASAIAASETIVPQSYEKDRYETTRMSSPFVLATKVQVTTADTPTVPFTQNLYVIGLGRAAGKEYVTIARLGDEKNPIRLWGNTANEDGLAVQQISWSDAFGKSKVTLRKGSETGEIGFNENAIKAPPQGGVFSPVNGKKPPAGPNGKRPDRIRVIQ